MALPSAELKAIGERFFAYMNARDYASAAELYAPGAIYESPALPEEGRLIGRAAIMGYFEAAMEGSDFQLSVMAHFTGVNMTVTLSSNDGVTFVDVLRVDDEGHIVEHLEVTPQALSG